MDDMALQLNQSQCITYVHRLGEYQYYNVCSGKVTIVPWGIFEYMTLSLSVAFLLALVMVIMFIIGLDIHLIRKIYKK